MASEFIEVFTKQLRQAMLKAAPDLAGASTPELDSLNTRIAELEPEIARRQASLATLNADLSRLDAPVAVGAGGKDFMKLVGNRAQERATLQEARRSIEAELLPLEAELAGARTRIPTIVESRRHSRALLRDELAQKLVCEQVEELSVEIFQWLSIGHFVGLKYLHGMELPARHSYWDGEELRIPEKDLRLTNRQALAKRRSDLGIAADATAFRDNALLDSF
jgi:uncharacterized small protein (DUF1192 family)